MANDKNNKNNDIKKWREEWSKEWGLEKQTEGLDEKAIKAQKKLVEDLEKEEKK